MHACTQSRHGWSATEGRPIFRARCAPQQRTCFKKTPSTCRALPDVDVERTLELVSGMLDPAVGVHFSKSASSSRVNATIYNRRTRNKGMGGVREDRAVRG